MSLEEEETSSSPSERVIPVTFFDQLRKNGKFLDLDIICKNNRIIKAHRLLMSAQFPGVSEILKNGDTKLDWTSFSYSIVEAIVDFAYTAQITISTSNVGRLYLMSLHLKCDPLSDNCMEFMEMQIDDLDMKEIWPIANISRKQRLQRLCVPRIANIFDQFSTNKDVFTHTTLAGLRLLLNSDELKPPSNTKAKINAIINWVVSAGTEQEKAKRESYFGGLLELLDLSTLPSNFTEDVALDNLEVAIPNNCKKILMKKLYQQNANPPL